jgi:hypothetical protein
MKLSSESARFTTSLRELCYVDGLLYLCAYLANLGEHGQSLLFAGTRHPGCDSCVAIDLYGSKHDRRLGGTRCACLKFWLINNVTFRIVRGYHVRGYHVSRTLMVCFFSSVVRLSFLCSICCVPPTPLVTLCVSHARHCLPL